MHAFRRGKHQGKEYHCLQGKERKISKDRGHHECGWNQGWAVSKNKRQHYGIVMNGE